MSKIILDVCEWDPNKSLTIGGVEVKASELARSYRTEEAGDQGSSS